MTFRITSAIIMKRLSAQVDYNDVLIKANHHKFTLEGKKKDYSPR